MKIKIESSELVRPTENTPRHVIWNSNIDLVIPRIHTPSVYFYKRDDFQGLCKTPTVDLPTFFSFEHLRDALSKALVPFYPMAGRLKCRDGMLGRVDIDCNAEGVLFVHASCDGNISDFGDHFTPSLKMRQLIPQIDYTQDMSTYPLLILQVTYFQCEGVALGVGVQHHVADGISALRFINSWADVSRGMDLNVELFMDRALLKARDPPQPMFEHIEYKPAPSLLKQEDCLHVNDPIKELMGKQILDKQTVLELDSINASISNGRVGFVANGHAEQAEEQLCWNRSKASSNVAMPSGCAGSVANGDSENGARPFHQNRRQGALQQGDGVYVEGLSNGVQNGKEHKKLNPEHHIEDCGFVTDLFSFTKEQLQALKNKAAAGLLPNERAFSTYETLSAHVWQCASIARGLQDSQLTKLYIATDGRTRLDPSLPCGYFGNAIFTATPVDTVGHICVSSLAEVSRCIRASLDKMNNEYLRSALDFLELQPDLSALARGAHTFGSPNLGLTSWVRLPIYAADFGWGTPLFMGPAGIPFEGLGYLLPGPPGDTSLKLSIALTPNHMKRFMDLLYRF